MGWCIAILLPLPFMVRFDHDRQTSGGQHVQRALALSTAGADSSGSCRPCAPGFLGVSKSETGTLSFWWLSTTIWLPA